PRVGGCLHADLLRLGNAGIQLGEQLVAGGGQPVDRAIDNIDRADVGEIAILERAADGDVGEAVAVEIADSQGPAEVLLRVTQAENTNGGWIERFVVQGGETVRTTVDNLELAEAVDIGVAASIVNDADCQVGKAVAVEVGRGHQIAKLVVLGGTVNNAGLV